MGVYLGSHRVKLNRAMELRTDDSVLNSIIDRTISVYENPVISEIGNYAFYNCIALDSVNLPQATSIGAYAFVNCTSLTSISLPKATSIGSYAFRSCYHLLSLYLMGGSVVSLASTTAFTSTPISTYTTSTGGVYGSIFVPASLYSSYLTATNWSIYSARIVSR